MTIWNLEHKVKITENIVNKLINTLPDKFII